MVMVEQVSIKAVRGERGGSVKSFMASLAISAALMIGAIEWVAWFSGAAWTPSMLAQKQLEDPNALVLPNDLRYFAPFKLARVAIAQPEVVFIGSSRCNEMRSAMFRPYTFYNACLSAWTLPQFVRMFDLMTRVSHPRVVVFSMDYFAFSDVYAAGEAKRDADFTEEGFGFHVASLRTLLSTFVDPASPARGRLAQYLTGVRSREPVDNMVLLGLSADRTAAGFRYDGSFLYPRLTISQAPEHNADVRYGVLSGIPGAAHVSELQMAHLRELSELAKARNVKLVGIQLPILGTVVDFLDHDKDYWAYAGVWREFASEDVQNQIRSYGISFFDLSRSDITKDSSNFIDPAHPNEAGMLGGLVELLDNAEFSSIFPKMNPEALRAEQAEFMRSREYFDLYHTRF